MKLFRKEPDLPDEEDLPPPPPVEPWRVPPMGSLGDAWDEVIELPEPPKPSPKPRKKKKRRTARRGEVLFREFNPPLHALVIIAWMIIAMGLLSTGPAFPLMPILGLFGVLVAGAAIVLLKTKHRMAIGINSAIGACIAGVLLILTEGLAPRSGPIEAAWIRPLSGPTGAMDFRQKIQYTENTIPVVAKAAICTWTNLGDKATALGRNSVNRDVYSGSIYFSMSTLIRPENAQAPGFNPEQLVYFEASLPPDPFADDPEATYGVFFTDLYLLIYSVGPDGEWQINPRKPVSERSPDPKADLAPHIYNPINGRLGSGDIVKVYPLNDATFVFCDEVRQALEERSWLN